MKCNEKDNSVSAPIAPSPRIYKIQLTSPAPWETVAHRPMGTHSTTRTQLPWTIEPGPLRREPIATATPLQTTTMSPECTRPNPSRPRKNPAICHQHPPTNQHHSQPQPHPISSPITGCLQEVHNITRTPMQTSRTPGPKPGPPWWESDALTMGPQRPGHCGHPTRPKTHLMPMTPL